MTPGHDLDGVRSELRRLGYLDHGFERFLLQDALKLAVEKLEGKDVPKRIKLPLPLVTNETIKYCETGSWEEMKAGCNAFPPALVPNPGWFASIFSPETPEIGFQAALVGQPEP